MHMNLSSQILNEEFLMKDLIKNQGTKFKSYIFSLTAALETGRLSAQRKFSMNLKKCFEYARHPPSCDGCLIFYICVLCFGELSMVLPFDMEQIAPPAYFDQSIFKINSSTRRAQVSKSLRVTSPCSMTCRMRSG